MEPYITVAVNAGQALATGTADYIAREKRRKVAQVVTLVALALLAGIILKRSR